MTYGTKQIRSHIVFEAPSTSKISTISDSVSEDSGDKSFENYTKRAIAERESILKMRLTSEIIEEDKAAISLRPSIRTAQL